LLVVSEEKDNLWLKLQSFKFVAENKKIFWACFFCRFHFTQVFNYENRSIVIQKLTRLNVIFGGKCKKC